LNAPATIRVSTRARAIRIRVSDTGVEIVVPPGTTQRRVDAALLKHADWIDRTRGRLQARPRLGMAAPGLAWLGGEPRRLVARDARRGVVEEVDAAIVVAGPDAEARDLALARWYRGRATAQLTALVGEEARRLALSPARVQVRAQRTRWGSWTPSSQTLTLNWRLILVSERIQRYVAVHELCHIARADHSPAFWALVADSLPGYRTERAWLRDHGAEVLAYVPRASPLT